MTQYESHQQKIKWHSSLTVHTLVLSATHLLTLQHLVFNH